jgi:hypothetical protein
MGYAYALKLASLKALCTRDVAEEDEEHTLRASTPTRMLMEPAATLNSTRVHWK